MCHLRKIMLRIMNYAAHHTGPQEVRRRGRNSCSGWAVYWLWECTRERKTTLLTYRIVIAVFPIHSIILPQMQALLECSIPFTQTNVCYSGKVSISTHNYMNREKARVEHWKSSPPLHPTQQYSFQCLQGTLCISFNLPASSTRYSIWFIPLLQTRKQSYLT